MFSFPDGHRDALTSTETSLCLLLARVINGLTHLCQSALELGPAADQLTTALNKAYAALDSLGKHLHARAKGCREVVVAVKFNKLVTLVAKGLTKHVYDFISHLEVLVPHSRQILSFKGT